MFIILSILEEFTTKYARTDETHDEALFNEVPEERRKTARGIEVGQIFYFGTNYSDKLNATVQGPDGKPVALHMGSHGMGVSRLLGALRWLAARGARHGRVNHHQCTVTWRPSSRKRRSNCSTRRHMGMR